MPEHPSSRLQHQLVSHLGQLDATQHFNPTVHEHATLILVKPLRQNVRLEHPDHHRFPFSSLRELEHRIPQCPPDATMLKRIQQVQREQFAIGLQEILGRTARGETNNMIILEGHENPMRLIKGPFPLQDPSFERDRIQNLLGHQTAIRLEPGLHMHPSQSRNVISSRSANHGSVYCQSLENAANKKFVAYKKKFGADSVITDPMTHGYVDVYLWKAAATKAKSLEPVAVRKAIVGIKWADSPLGPISVEKNGSITQRVYIGESGEGGQFKILWQSKAVVKPQPYDPLSFPGKSCP
jgi:hypothetical protein